MNMSAQRTLLVVDDDPELLALLKSFFGRNGFRVASRADGSDVEAAIEAERPDLIVLDIMLPGEDGMALCRRLRGAQIDTPIIMLTGRGDEVDRIIGLEMGADDYLAKPFNPRELLARVEAVLRRARNGAGDGNSVTIRFGPFELDQERRELRREGRMVALTTGEYELLQVLAKRPGRPMNRDVLLDQTRGRDYNATDRTIDVQISKLRRAIEENPAQPRYIKTVWGYGYVFSPHLDPEEPE